MESPVELKGPNLVDDGVAANQLVDGEPLLGHAAGEPVLLVRRGLELFAIGATCSHYGGPLGEGLVDGETIRCPWHHARFDLRTGLPTTPALKSIPCWRVEERGERVHVCEKRASLAPAAASASSHAPSALESIVVIGGGAAGHAAVETLRREGFSGKVTLISEDHDAPYDRPNLSKDYLAGTATEDWIPLRSRAFFDAHAIDLVLGTSVDRIDARSRTVVLEGGATHPFDALLLATGSDPVRLTVPGADLPHVRYLRSLDDSRAITSRLPATKHAVVIGASFIALEVAAALRTRGVDVHVIAPDERPLQRVLGPDVGDFLRRLHEAKGVVFHLGRTVASIANDSVTLDDGSLVRANLVVVGIGVRPATGLAERGGLRVDQGVLVDEYLETSAPGIYAAGDIARWPDFHTGTPVRVEHWVVAQRHGELAARNMLGRKVPCRLVPFFWSQHYDLAISYVGHAEKWDRIDVDGSLETRDCTLAYRSGNRTLAVVTIGRDRASLEAEAAFERDDARTLGAIAASASPLRQLHDAGQAIWLDALDRTMLADGSLRRRIDEDGLSGVTSNPTIFEKALATGDAYDLQIASAPRDMSTAHLFERIATDDVRAACDLFRDLHRRTRGADGFVSIEVSPRLAHDEEATVAEARRLWDVVSRPNLMVKIPGTPEGAHAVRRCIADGLNINITLLFSLDAYRAVIDAYLAGLEERAARDKPLAGIHSVASFFVSRVDAEVDARIAALLPNSSGAQRKLLERLQGKVAIANARLAFELFRQCVDSPRWDALARLGATVQRPLWASTGTKNPAYRDVVYVEDLIGPDTVNTMPPATIEAFRDHGVVARTIDARDAVDTDPRRILSALAEVGISLESVTTKLLIDGIASFTKSFEALSTGLERRRDALSK